MRAESFPPIANQKARRLVLGSMPGQASLTAQAYYVHPRNAFWPIMETVYGIAPHTPYAERCAVLREAGIAVWDVLQSCQRPGSLDADIEPDSIITNNFAGFFAVHREIRKIGFNGSTAERCFLHRVLPTLPDELRQQLQLQRLPSTSPAHAAWSFDAKLAVWRHFLLE